MGTVAGVSRRTRITLNQERQRELYGAPLGDRVRRLTATLGISQARLARTLGISPAMLSQLVSARRVKIGDPAVLARMLILDQRCPAVRRPPDPRAVDVLLAEVAKAQWQWNGRQEDGRQGDGRQWNGPRAPAAQRPPRAPAAGGAAEALRAISEPARLAAAAAALGPGFPELAEVLRQAARRPRA
jgi:transcriptional regulator with XRE-family HTH domain